MSTDLSTNENAAFRWFTDEMRTKLLANAHKGGWSTCRPVPLLARLYEEANELREAIGRGAPIGEVAREAADVANFAMMVADVASRGLTPDDQAAAGHLPAWVPERLPAEGDLGTWRKVHAIGERLTAGDNAEHPEDVRREGHALMALAAEWGGDVESGFRAGYRQGLAKGADERRSLEQRGLAAWEAARAEALAEGARRERERLLALLAKEITSVEQNQRQHEELAQQASATSRVLRDALVVLQGDGG